MPSLSLEEQETHLNMVADDRNTWHVYSDDQVMQRRLESIGATFIKASGAGKHYTLTSDQISFKKGKPQLSEEEKARRVARMKTFNAAKKAAT